MQSWELMIKLKELGTLCTVACLTGTSMWPKENNKKELNTDVLVRGFGVELLYYLNRNIITGKQIMDPDS